MGTHRDIKRRDTYPFLQGTLSDGAGPVDLTGSTARIILRTKGTSPVVLVDAPIAYTTPATGEWEYEWDPADTAALNELDGEIEVTWGDGEITTFPTIGFFSVQVHEDLD